MSMFEASPSPWTSRMLSIFRMVGGLMFLATGTMKLCSYPPFPAGTPPMPPIEMMSQVGIGGLLELIGGALILIGLFTRPVSFILAGEMAVAYFQFHQPMGLWPNTNNGIPAVMYCFFFLYLMFAGAGVWSIDALIAHRGIAGRGMVQQRS